MALTPALLDTDTVSYLLRYHPAAIYKAQIYTAQHGQLTISMMTRYEVLRGLLAKDAKGQLSRFERFCSDNEILPLTGEIADRAADIHADLYKRGQTIGDADTFIAATALVHNLVVITNNQAHYRRIPGLQIDNWLT